MKEREEPTFVTFATGECHEGVLLAVERIRIKDKDGIRYTMRTEDGSFISFLGTWQLNSKLRKDDVGHYVSITCKGEDTMVTRGENSMKVFDVKVSEKPASAYSERANPEITDEDIGF